MKKIAVVYFSGYGHTKKQAEAVIEGAQRMQGIHVQGVELSNEGELPEVAWADLANADAIIMGSPTYMGSVAWQFKKFADASSKAWFEQKWKNKLAAGFTNSASMNGDKSATLYYLFTLAMQHSMIWAGTGLMPSNAKDAQRNDVNFLGSFAGAMAQSPSDSSAEEGPLPGDLQTARLFGERIASLALSMTTVART